MEDYLIKALPVKNWIVGQISPLGWATLTMRALPELLEENPDFRMMHVNRRTTWTQREMDIIAYYLHEYYDIELDENLVSENSDLTFDYFSLTGLGKIKNTILGKLKLLKLAS